MCDWLLKIHLLQSGSNLLLLCRKFKPDTVYQVCTSLDGGVFNVEDVDSGPGAFRAYLNVGFAHTIIGTGILETMIGAVDGAIDIPHSTKRFPVYDSEIKDFNAD